MVGGIEGVAESESPIGPFRHARMLPCKGIDPTVYIEGEKIYYFWGQFYLHGAELNKTFDAFCRRNGEGRNSIGRRAFFFMKEHHYERLEINIILFLQISNMENRLL